MAELSIPRLSDWLKHNLDISHLHSSQPITEIKVGEIATPKSGYSAETIIFPAEVTQGDTSHQMTFVLRRETPDDAVYPAQSPDIEVEISIQYRAMQAVAKTSCAPIAPLHHYEPDPQVLGAPFFVMGFVPGEVPVEDPNYTTSGFFFEAAPEQRRRMILGGIKTMADIHSINWQDAGLDWLVPEGVIPGTARQLMLWENAADKALNGREHPSLKHGFEWLQENLPQDSPVGVGWGDARLGNIIWQDFKPACVTDFEAVAITPPEFDLGWWLMFDRWSHDHIGGPRLEGEPTLEEQREHYLSCAEASGIQINPDNIFFHEVFAATRYTAIVVRVMNRSVLRGELPADNIFWLKNPVVDCLDALLPD